MENVKVVNELVLELVEAIEKANNNWCIQIEANGYEYIADVIVDDVNYMDATLALRYDSCTSTIRGINFAARNNDIPGMTEYSIGNSVVRITFTHSNLD